jgi:hypothetical protein
MRKAPAIQGFVAAADGGRLLREWKRETVAVY